MANVLPFPMRYGNAGMIVVFAVAAGVALFAAMLLYFGEFPEHESRRRRR